MKEQIVESNSALCTWVNHPSNKELAIVTAQFDDGPPVRKIILLKKIIEAGIEEGERFLGTVIVYGNPLRVNSGSKRTFFVEKLPTREEALTGSP